MGCYKPSLILRVQFPLKKVLLSQGSYPPSNAISAAMSLSGFFEVLNFSRLRTSSFAFRPGKLNVFGQYEQFGNLAVKSRSYQTMFFSVSVVKLSNFITIMQLLGNGLKAKMGKRVKYQH